MRNKLLALCIGVLALTGGVICSPCIYAAPTDALLLSMAQQGDHRELAEVLLKYGKDPQYPALNQAMDARDFSAVRVLVDHGVDINSRDNRCKEQGSIAVGSDVILGVWQGKTVLETAIALQNYDLIEFFLLHKASPHVTRSMAHTYRNGTAWWDVTALYDAINIRDFECLEMLFSHGADVNATCYTSRHSGCMQEKKAPLRIAVDCSDPELVEWLLDHGANP
jgi:hypothetical protein